MKLIILFLFSIFINGIYSIESLETIKYNHTLANYELTCYHESLNIIQEEFIIKLGIFGVELVDDYGHVALQALKQYPVEEDVVTKGYKAFINAIFQLSLANPKRIDKITDESLNYFNKLNEQGVSDNKGYKAMTTMIIEHQQMLGIWGKRLENKEMCLLNIEFLYFGKQ